MQQLGGKALAGAHAAALNASPWRTCKRSWLHSWASERDSGMRGASRCASALAGTQHAAGGLGLPQRRTSRQLLVEATEWQQRAHGGNLEALTREAAAAAASGWRP